MRSIRFSSAEVFVLPDAAAVSRAVADEILRCVAKAQAGRGCCTLALAGGSTPRAVYALLAAEAAARAGAVAWDKLEIFFGDERPVPPDHPESNYRMACDAWLSRAPIPPHRVHRIRGEADARLAAREYETQLRQVFGLAPPEVPRFDLILLGLGTDGHTASLFPCSQGLEEKSALVCANWVEKLGSFRISFTLPLLNAAEEVVFLATGAEKASVLSRVLQGDPRPAELPAQRVQPSAGRLVWMVDEAAAAEVGGQ